PNHAGNRQQRLVARHLFHFSIFWLDVGNQRVCLFVPFLLFRRRVRLRLEPWLQRRATLEGFAPAPCNLSPACPRRATCRPLCPGVGGKKPCLRPQPSRPRRLRRRHWTCPGGTVSAPP